MKEFLGITGIIVLLVILIGIGPILTLISVNALFGLNIAYTLGNWLAVVWLSLLFLPKRIGK